MFVIMTFMSQVPEAPSEGRTWSHGLGLVEAVSLMKAKHQEKQRRLCLDAWPQAVCLGMAHRQGPVLVGHFLVSTLPPQLHKPVHFPYTTLLQ